MVRGQKRRLALVYLFAVAIGLVWFGFAGWTINLLPAQYLGYLIAAFGVAALCGVNIWYNGPLDPRFDPPTPPDDEATATASGDAEPGAAADGPKAGRR